MQKSAKILSGALLLLTACNEMVLEPGLMGSMALSLSSDVEIEAPVKSAGSINLDEFQVAVKGETATGEAYLQEYVYGDMDADESVPIPFGAYTVSAQSCTEAKAAEGLGCVRYHGCSDEFQVESMTVVPVTVRCTMVNAKASLTLDQSFLEDFDDISVKLKVSYTEEGQLKEREVDVPVNSEHPACGQEVYFNVPAAGGSLTYSVSAVVCKGTAQERTVTYSNSTSPMTLLPAKWAKIIVRSNHNGIIGGPDISVDDTMGDNSFTEIIDPDGGTEIIESEMNLPTIYVDTTLDDAIVVDCVLDVN